MQDLLKQLGIHLEEGEVEKLHELGHLIRQKNEEINLTSFKELEDICRELLVDSLAVIITELIPDEGRLLDVGSGAGVPGLPLAIVKPDLQVTLLDSVTKKMTAAQGFADALGLSNISTLSDRAEELGQDKKHREQYDVVIAKAFAPLNVLLELCVPFVKPGGVLIAYKGQRYQQEIKDAQNAMAEMQVDQPLTKSYQVTEDQGERQFLVFHKEVLTPQKYPRRTGTPKKNPL